MTLGVIGLLLISALGNSALSARAVEAALGCFAPMDLNIYRPGPNAFCDSKSPIRLARRAGHLVGRLP